MTSQLKTEVLKAAASVGILRIFKCALHGRASIFLLHRLGSEDQKVDSVTASTIEHALKTLRRSGAIFSSIEEIFSNIASGRAIAPGTVAFTIDDGFRDQGTIAKVFLSHGVTPTIFLVTGFIDGSLWPWDDQIAFCVENSKRESLRCRRLNTTFSLHNTEARKNAADGVQKLIKSLEWRDAEAEIEAIYDELRCRPPVSPPPRYTPLTWDEIRHLEKVGARFAPHSVTHRITSRLTSDEVKEEISESWARVKSELRYPLDVYAWPTGRHADFSDRDIDIARCIGLRGALATNDNYANFLQARTGERNLFQLNRFSLSAELFNNIQYGTGLERLKQIARGDR